MKKIFIIAAIALFAGSLNAQIDRSIRPSAAPAKELKISDAKTFTLANGLKVFVVEDHRAPTVFYSLGLDIKPALEGDKAGMYDLFSSVFGTATKKRSKEQINRELDLIAARLSANSNGGSVSVLKKYEQKALELMTDILFNPVFKQEELDLNLEKTKSALASIVDDGSDINRRVSAALTYGRQFPYGEIETVKTVENVSISDLQKFYDTYFAPNVARLVIVGDVSLDEAKASAKKYFDKWQRKTVPETKYVIPQKPEKTIVAMVEKSGAVQSSIDVSYPVQYRLGDEGGEAAALMSYILGGGSSSRLFLNLRESHSYTYGIYCSLSRDDIVGRFNLSAGRGDAASVKAAATDSAIIEIFSEINRIINNPVSEEELKNAKAYFAGSFGRSLAEPSTIAQQAVNIDKYRLPKDFYKNYLKRLEAVTVADVKAAAVKYLHPNNALIVVTGDRSYAESLKKLSTDGNIHFYDADANPVAAPSTLTANVTPQTVIDAYIKAIGGKEAIDKVNDSEMVMETSIAGQTLTIKKLYKKPNMSSLSISAGAMVVQKVLFDGKTVKMSAMGQTKEFTEGKEFESIANEVSMFPELNYTAENGYELTVTGIEKTGGKDSYVLKVKKGSFNFVEYFDVESGLKVKTVDEMETPQGTMQQIAEYSDYRTVENIKIPHTRKQSVQGITNMEATVKSIVINKGIGDDMFK
ncbi:MAG: insulinase family protein [Prevotellaceae bacterium]|jgi:predicted Zn-dependent peptidase|nr:insulinase family protein [Prevotellaceae bacterium]